MICKIKFKKKKPCQTQWNIACYHNIVTMTTVYILYDIYVMRLLS